MRTYRKEEQWVDIIDTLKCDRCGTNIDSGDILELQECVSFHFTCGYNSTTWGDMSMVECDLCQECIYTLIKDFARVVNE